MWWKLGLLLLTTAALVVAVIPVQTHAVLYDPTKGPPPHESLRTMLGAMYLTPGTALLIVVIVALAAFIGLKVVRREW